MSHDDDISADRTATEKLVPALPEPDERQKARVADARERVQARRTRVSLQVLSHEGEVGMVCSPHADQHGFVCHMMDAFGTSSAAFSDAMLSQLGRTVGFDPRAISEPDVNAALAAVDGIAPRNEAEGMLAVQMAATHNVAMDLLRRAKFSSTLPGVTEYGNLATKLLRTYTAQLEALAKFRRGGEQKVKVEHVHVHEGGQAIVGSVTHPGPGGGSSESWRQSHALEPAGLAYAPGTALRSEDPVRPAVPVPSNQRPEAMPDARRQRGRASRAG